MTYRKIARSILHVPMGLGRGGHICKCSSEGYKKSSDIWKPWTGASDEISDGILGFRWDFRFQMGFNSKFEWNKKQTLKSTKDQTKPNQTKPVGLLLQANSNHVSALASAHADQVKSYWGG